MKANGRWIRIPLYRLVENIIDTIKVDGDYDI